MYSAANMARDGPGRKLCPPAATQLLKLPGTTQVCVVCIKNGVRCLREGGIAYCRYTLWRTVLCHAGPTPTTHPQLHDMHSSTDLQHPSARSHVPGSCSLLYNILHAQASRAELMTELQRLQAVQLGPYWRLVDTACLGSVLEMLMVR